jgi:hemerythrin
MVLLRWRESLALGVSSIDRDHKQLIDALNRLHYVEVAGDDTAAIADALEAVVEYTKGHFRREEMLMRLSGYPGYAAHCRVHREMVDRAAELQARFRADPRHFKVATFYDALADWLVAHVLEEDTKIKPWVEKLEEATAA